MWVVRTTVVIADPEVDDMSLQETADGSWPSQWLPSWAKPVETKGRQV